jgi:Ni/Fe-hydrogenase subunit HybB-like protein
MAWAARSANARMVRLMAAWVVIGVVVNRLNIALVAWGWDQPGRYFPSWMEIAASLAIVTMGVLCFRWIVNRMPVLAPDPRFDDMH